MFFSQPITTNILQLNVTCDWPSTRAVTTHSVCGVVKLSVFDGNSVVAFYATEIFPSHDQYLMKYSIGISTTLRVLVSVMIS